MLKEISSPAFREKGKERPPIKFKPGLNVVLGKEDGANSIGKSSALLAIDFVFGGNTYISSDGVKHIGHHTIFFTFEFDGKKYYFARNTENAEQIQVCDSHYNLTGSVFTKAQYIDWLKKKYHIDFQGLNFRQTLSSFFRIYGKGNTDETKPLAGIPGDNMEKSINRLIALFNRYQEIEDYTNRRTAQEDKLKAYKQARSYDFVSNLVGGKEQYEKNETEIKSLKMQLETLTSEQVEAHNEEDIEKSRKKSELKDRRLRLEEQIDDKRRRLSLIKLSLEYGVYPTEADLTALQKFFPTVNLRKLYEIEKYHKKLAKILDGQFNTERENLLSDINDLENQRMVLNDQIRQLGFVGNLSKEFLVRYSEIKGKMDALRIQNQAYLTLTELQEQKKAADKMLKRAIASILADMQDSINDQMKAYNDTLFAEPHKPPVLQFNDYNSYRFETPDDTGTGSNFKGMIIFDLAILALTDLPAIAHDSLILKNISDGSIDGIMKIYSQSEKQIFIAFDKQDSYGPQTRKILYDNRVLQLSDDERELYGESWNIGVINPDENQL